MPLQLQVLYLFQNSPGYFSEYLLLGVAWYLLFSMMLAKYALTKTGSKSSSQLQLGFLHGLSSQTQLGIRSGPVAVFSQFKQFHTCLSVNFGVSALISITTLRGSVYEMSVQRLLKYSFNLHSSSLPSKTPAVGVCHWEMKSTCYHQSRLPTFFGPFLSSLHWCIHSQYSTNLYYSWIFLICFLTLASKVGTSCRVTRRHTDHP